MSPARVLVAPDAFKGTIRAAEVASAIAAGLRESGWEARECPVADGGEGTVEVIAEALGAEHREAVCADPLGRPVSAAWAWIEQSRTAIVEMASVSGLALLSEQERDAERASSAGTGELIVVARDAGAERTILAVGGTATSDGGAGALGRLAEAGGLGAMRLDLACDVRVRYEHAAEVFGPQKGASPEAVARLTARLHALAERLPRDPRGLPMSGAGGGLAGGMWAVYGAELLSGACFVLEALGFDRLLDTADAVVIGEGRLDEQSRRGKIAGEILDRALARSAPIHAIVGSLDEPAVRREWGALASVQVAGTPPELRLAGARLVPPRALPGPRAEGGG